MQFTKQHDSLPIENVEFNTIQKTDNRHGSLLPNSIRSLIVGPSNCGKTNVMLSLILHPNGLKFKNIYIYSKSLHQPKYILLDRILSAVPTLGYCKFSSNDDVISPGEAKSNSLMIFDDVACDKQNNIRAYFCMGRHKNIDCFYLCQSYTHIPKHLIRDNTNLLIVFQQDELNLRHIYNDSVNMDMSFDTFHKACTECWKNPYSFLVIDKDSSINEGRYRKGFDTYISIKEGDKHKIGSNATVKKKRAV